MNEEKFNEAFKILKRFAKEEGKYIFLMNYLFPKGRTKKDFYNDVNRMTIIYNFGDILHIIYTLGPSYRTLGDEYWQMHIRELSDKFIKYWRKINLDKRKKIKTLKK